MKMKYLTAKPQLLQLFVSSSFSCPGTLRPGARIRVGTDTGCRSRRHGRVAPVAHICYNSSRTTANTEPRRYNFTGTPFLISPEKNEFTGIGCYTLALLGDWDGGDGDDNYLLGLDKAAKDGESCTGQGCCQTPTLPRDLDILKVVLSSGGAKPVNPAWNYSRCSYGFVAAKTWYKFKRGDLNGTGDMAPGKRVPLVLDWAIPDSKVGACASNHSHPEPLSGRAGNGTSANAQTGTVETHTSMELGDASVYRGTTHENLRVAVKRSVVEGTKPSKDHDMVNEIATLFEIRHANLVRLIGCCLETEVPMLVLEYVSNGSLYSVLHCGSTPRVLPLSVRLDIAIGSAQALAYMHSHGGRSLVHGDVKTGNILLGDNLTPKVSDFGSSKLESIARHGNFCIMGDLSYIDPVYKETGHFTQKSDVYSFGVVLLELITRKTATYGNNNSLTMEFVESCKEEGNGRKMYDSDIILSDGQAQSHRYVECLDQIGMLAIRCLKEDKDERPSMEEVVEELMQVKLKARGDTSCKTS